MPVPEFTFEGISSDDNNLVYGFRVLPPDTNGDVGPNHYVQVVNNLFRVFDKTTGTPLTPPLQQSRLFAEAGLTGPCATRDDGDPIVLYDPLADRWLISQFAVPDPFFECIAVSQTGDPTGRYFLYAFQTPKFADYPHFGVWPDGYYMTGNQFNSGFLGVGVFAFERAKMLVGDPTASYIYFDLEAVEPDLFGLLPSDLDGPPPPVGTPNYLMAFTATEMGDPQDALRIFEFHADFTNPASSTLAERPESPITTAPFNPLFSGGRDNIPQPSPAGPNAKLDAISDRLMYRLQYRNFGTHEALVVNHTVDVDEMDHAGVRYYEVRRNLPGGLFFIHEHATFAPDVDHRWMGSAALDNQGNLAVGYSVSSPTTFPSIRYAGRLATDSPGGLFQGETTLQAGGGSQTSTSSRWGDYSMLAVDPEDDCTFWYTNEYYATSSSAGWQTRIGRFKFPSCTPPSQAQGTLQGTVTDASTGSPIEDVLVQTSNGFARSTDPSGNYAMTLPAGTYTVTASAFGYQASMVSGLVVADGGTTIQSFTLTPLPLHTLTVTKAGTGSGTVISNSAGINCGEDCSEVYPSGTPVTLRALPAAGSTFSGWSGACTGKGDCPVRMDADKSVTATFTKSGGGKRGGSQSSHLFDEATREVFRQIKQLAERGQPFTKVVQTSFTLQTFQRLPLGTGHPEEPTAITGGRATIQLASTKDPNIVSVRILSLTLEGQRFSFSPRIQTIAGTLDLGTGAFHLTLSFTRLMTPETPQPFIWEGTADGVYDFDAGMVSLTEVGQGAFLAK
ncbi:MAG: carboxypeptidase regulatory-like domain-containing protein [Candidatus Methylomirabilales bacterium]